MRYFSLSFIFAVLLYSYIIYDCRSETTFKDSSSISSYNDTVGSLQLCSIYYIESNNDSQKQKVYLNEKLLLAKVISAEARGEPFSGQVAVGAVILNRTQHPSFPDTIYEVCYQPGAFSCINDGQINMTPTLSSIKAAEEALSGSDPSGGAVYFYNPDTAANDWIRTRPVIKTIGNHRFCT
ncbi:MAG: hypothetical protein E7546_02975 [Ruminococcaceae bacterium]|nr:hypothetical protein [Oscillospiraceae bacterium]